MGTIKKYSIRKTLVGAGSVLIGTFALLSYSGDSEALATEEVTTIVNEDNEEEMPKSIPYISSDIVGDTLTDEQKRELEEAAVNFYHINLRIEYEGSNIIIYNTDSNEISATFTVEMLKNNNIFEDNDLEAYGNMMGSIIVNDKENIHPLEITSIEKNLTEYFKYRYNLVDLKIIIEEDGIILKAKNVKPKKYPKSELDNIVKDLNNPKAYEYNQYFTLLETLAINNGYVKKPTVEDNNPIDTTKVDISFLYFLMRDRNLPEWGHYLSTNEVAKQYMEENNIEYIAPAGYKYKYDDKYNVLANDLSSGFLNPYEKIMKVNVFYKDKTYEEKTVKVVDGSYNTRLSAYSLKVNDDVSNDSEYKRKNSAEKVIYRLKNNGYNVIAGLSAFTDNEYMKQNLKRDSENNAINILGGIEGAIYDLAEEFEAHKIVADHPKDVLKRLRKHLQDRENNLLWINYKFNFKDGSVLYIPIVYNRESIFFDGSNLYNLALIEKDNFVEDLVNKTSNDIIIPEKDLKDNLYGAEMPIESEINEDYYNFLKSLYPHKEDITFEEFSRIYKEKVYNSFLTHDESREVITKFQDLYLTSAENKLDSVFYLYEVKNSIFDNTSTNLKNHNIIVPNDNINLFEHGLKHFYKKDDKLYKIDWVKTLKFFWNHYSLSDNPASPFSNQFSKARVELLEDIWNTNPEAFENYSMFYEEVKKRIYTKQYYLANNAGPGYMMHFLNNSTDLTVEEKQEYLIHLGYSDIFEKTKLLLTGKNASIQGLREIVLFDGMNAYDSAREEERQQGLGNLQPWMRGSTYPFLFSTDSSEPNYTSNIYFYSEVGKEERHPNTYPTWELPSIEIPEIPNIPPNTTDNEGTPPLPPEPDPEPEEESTHPNTYPTWELPEAEVGVHPNTYPTWELPEAEVEVHPNTYPMWELPEAEVGVYPNTHPTHELPEAEVGVHPNTYPTIDKPEGNVGIYPNTYPTWELPEINLNFKVPNTYPTIEKPEANLDFKIPNTYPTWEMPRIDFPTKPTPPPIIPEDKVEIPPKEKELPKTNVNNIYMYSTSTLIGLVLLLKRKRVTK